MYYRQNRIIRQFILIFIFLNSFVYLSSYTKAMWLTIWEFYSPEKIDRALADAKENNINQLLVQVRYRGDALYIPNKINNFYHNPEELNHYIRNTGFDPLQYILEQTEESAIEVHAWVTVFVKTPRNLENLTSEHIFFKKPEWVTQDFFGNPMDHTTYEGAYFDPGIPDLQNYLINIYLDILSNYSVQGLHLDYIRYPDNKYGFNSISISEYYKFTENYQNQMQISLWKEFQINRFIRRLYAEIKMHFPEITLSAAVISNPYIAREKYSQYWLDWLLNNYIDYVYLMAYEINNNEFENNLRIIKDYNLQDRVIVGLRAWSIDNSYPVDQIIHKINLIKNYDFPGYALFSYQGLIQNNYFEGLRPLLKKQTRKNNIQQKSKNDSIVYGYVINSKNKPINNARVTDNFGNSSTTDPNGFYFLNTVSHRSIKLTVSKNGIYKSTNNLVLPSNLYIKQQNFIFD